MTVVSTLWREIINFILGQNLKISSGHLDHTNPYVSKYTTIKILATFGVLFSSFSIGPMFWESFRNLRFSWFQCFPLWYGISINIQSEHKQLAPLRVVYWAKKDQPLLITYGLIPKKKLRTKKTKTQQMQICYWLLVIGYWWDH